MSKPQNPSIAGVALLMLVSAAWSSANAQATSNEAATSTTRDLSDRPAPANGAYASEVPREAISNFAPADTDNQDPPTLATDHEEQSIPVAEEIDFVKDNSFRKPFEESLKTVARVDYYGTRYVECEHYPLEVHTARPNRVNLLMKTGDSSKYEGSRSNQGVKLRGIPQGLGVEEERALLVTFDFDTPILELEKNPHAFKPLGMQKLPGILAWKLQVDRPGSYYRILYVDSHYGDIVKFIIMNAQGARVVDVSLHDYRAVEGIRVPFAIDYRRADGTLLASDRLERVTVTRTRS
jgi:hypothetical protein